MAYTGTNVPYFKGFKRITMKKYKVISILIFAMLLSLVLAGCSDSTLLDDYKNQGNTVAITYDGNGGDFIGSQTVSIVDLLNPDKYTKDSSGYVHIKLTEPTAKLRPSGGSKPVTLSMQGYFFAGWYKNRELKKDENGNVLDWNGRILEEIDGNYYVRDSEDKPVGYPACVSYSDRWDFASDTVDVKVDEDRNFSLTLYAGWVPYYAFDYYYEESEGNWVKYATTSFDYKTTNAEGSTTYDRDTMFIPKYKDGAMNYKIPYNDGKNYDFPSRDGYTFEAAYSDEACTQQITESFEHQGTLNLETGTSVNSVQNIYVKFLDGVIYKINTAEELSKNGNAKGIYYIENDLDFTGVTWPNALQYNAFEGKFYGNGHTISNLSVKFNSTSARCGGLFGSVAIGAVIENLTIENLTYDYVATGYTSGGAYGLIAGDINDQSTVSINLIGDLNLRIGNVSWNTAGASASKINVVAGGNLDGITCDKSAIKLTLYGKLMYGSNPPEYTYSYKPDTVSVDNDGYINIEVGGIHKYNQENYLIPIGGQNE